MSRADPIFTKTDREFVLRKYLTANPLPCQEEVNRVVGKGPQHNSLYLRLTHNLEFHILVLTIGEFVSSFPIGSCLLYFWEEEWDEQKRGFTIVRGLNL